MEGPGPVAWRVHFQTHRIYDVSPPRGGIASGTLVDIVGTGFDEETRFVFEDRELLVEAASDQHVVARTPRHRMRWISLTAESAFATSVLPSANILTRRPDSAVCETAARRLTEHAVVDGMTVNRLALR